ncbi:hypothetical protein ACLB0R_07970 [Sphingomonas sp. GlSt437]|uniref:hypothetical protein n=1 Tax=Sphingomonas sp. GlSt437 TaxID=3389970 RepID=UPI003A883BD1
MIRALLLLMVFANGSVTAAASGTDEALPTGHSTVSFVFSPDGSITACDVASDPFWQHIPKERTCNRPNWGRNIALTFGISLEKLRRGLFRISALQDGDELTPITNYEYRKEMGRVELRVTPEGKLTDCKVLSDQGFGKCDPSIETVTFALPPGKRPTKLTFVWEIAASTRS